MKTIKILSIVTCLCIAVLITAFGYKTPSGKPPVNKGNDKGFAVVELFTSEGCSSCPPADAVVAKIEKEVADRPVYILAYHVDYWNRLGWKDVFSSADYSRRQNDYANWLKLSSVYTPQVIVNGRTEFVGSQEGKLRSAITAGLQKTGKSTINLSNLKIEANKLMANYSAASIPANTTLLVALVQKNATTVVKSGENGGHTLSHVQIVNNIQSVSLNGDKTGSIGIALPAKYSLQSWEVIAFVQNTLNGEIVAATHSVVPAAVMAAN